jgi:outer membrane protein
MSKRFITNVGCFLVVFLAGANAWGQTKDTIWTLPKCIDYAMQKNISIQEKVLSNETNRVNANQAKASRFPSLNASVSQNFGWNKQLDMYNEYGSLTGSNGTSYSINSNIKLYNGFKISNSIKQAEISYKAGSLDVDAMKEAISLSVMDAYLQVLYSEELVKNSQKQIESTSEQLNLSDERLKLGAIAKSDYLQVKSELANENLTLANALNQLAINRLALMQLMELTVTDSFAIQHPDFSIPQNLNTGFKADSIYNIALGIKPQIKSSALNKQIAELDVSIARAGYQPTLSLSGGLSTGYLSGMGLAYDYQVKNKINPTVGLSLSIPIYQNRQVRSNVAIAKISTSSAELQEINTKNQLRKSIEQACVNVKSAVIKYQASSEKFNSAQESYKVVQEKFVQGLLNSVDYLIQKTNLITAESELLQAKYNLVFSKKILDFYTGIPLSL